MSVYIYAHVTQLPMCKNEMEYIVMQKVCIFHINLESISLIIINRLRWSYWEDYAKLKCNNAINFFSNIDLKKLHPIGGRSSKTFSTMETLFRKRHKPASLKPGEFLTKYGLPHKPLMYSFSLVIAEIEDSIWLHGCAWGCFYGVRKAPTSFSVICIQFLFRLVFGRHDETIVHQGVGLLS